MSPGNGRRYLQASQINLRFADAIDVEFHVRTLHQKLSFFRLQLDQPIERCNCFRSAPQASSQRAQSVQCRKVVRTLLVKYLQMSDCLHRIVLKDRFHQRMSRVEVCWSEFHGLA